MSKMVIKDEDLPKDLLELLMDAPSPGIKEALRSTWGLQKSSQNSNDYKGALKYITSKFNLAPTNFVKNLEEPIKGQNVNHDEEVDVFQKKNHKEDNNSGLDTMGSSQVSGDGTQRNEGICRFWRRGNCKKGKDCKFQHPDQCRRFLDFGLGRYNKKGCHDENCPKLHPRICKTSLKHGHCKAELMGKCKFHHLKVNVLKTSREGKGRYKIQDNFNKTERTGVQTNNPKSYAAVVAQTSRENSQLDHFLDVELQRKLPLIIESVLSKILSNSQTLIRQPILSH